jgi:DNA-binding NarL/FixJ family response regulator
MNMNRKSRPAEASDTPRKVFIVDDHPVFRHGLEQLVNAEPDLTVCGTSGTVAQALKGIERTQPNLVLVDISLPDRSGLDLIKELRTKNRTLKLLVVSMHDEALYANRVLRAGGDGYVMKDEEPGEIIDAIHDILEGHIYVSEQVLSGKHGAASGATAEPSRESRRLAELTDTELEILELLGYGKTNQEIARKLRLAARKVSASLTAIQRKLKLKSYNALIRYAVCWTEAGEA